MDRSRIEGWLYRLPVVYRIVLVNAGVVFLFTGAAAAVVLLLLGHPPEPWALAWAGAAALAAALLSLPLHRSALHLLLRPLHELERTAVRVEQGDLRARARLSPSTDPTIHRLAYAFNRLLDAVVADRQRLRDVAARAFRAQEAERARIARELQEETAQTLATTLLLLRAARQTPEPAARDALLDELRDELMRTTDGIRGFARALQPPALKDLGLLAALEGYARALAKSAGLAVRIAGDEPRGRISAEAELALYRIVQEALANVARHAGATRATVDVRAPEDGVEVVIADDGAGFALEATEARQPCLGLFGMRERALSVGGTLCVRSTPGAGTEVRVRVPAGAATAGAATAPWPVIVRPPDPASATAP